MEEIMDAWASWLVTMFMFLTVMYCILDWYKMGTEDQRREPVNVIADEDAQFPETPAPRGPYGLRQRYTGDVRVEDRGGESNGNQGGDGQNGDRNGNENGNGNRNANGNGDGNGERNGGRNGIGNWILTILAFYGWVSVFRIGFFGLLIHLKIRSVAKANATIIHE